MHSRNPYRTPPDFHQLAESYPPLAKHLKGRIIDFHDDDAQRCLTQALLKRDFGLELHLPPNRLCPPVPNRLNYVLWIQDIAFEHWDAFLAIAAEREGKVRVQGLDIGTGASAIYPLLACTLNPEWTFIATELDNTSYHHALTNIANNNLSPRIHLIKVDETPDSRSTVPEQSPSTTSTTFNFNQLFGFKNHLSDPQAQSDKIDRIGGLDIQFTMCNPPFYGSTHEMTLGAAEKEDRPFGICTGAPVEMITPGGEVAFVCSMIRECVASSREQGSEGLGSEPHEDKCERASKRRRLDSYSPSIKFDTTNQHVPPKPGSKMNARNKLNLSRWYTSMLGKLSSVVDVVDLIKSLEITNYAVTEFMQGQTRRWAVGWSLGPWRLSDDVSRIADCNPTLTKIMPPRNTLKFTLGHLNSVSSTTITPAAWMQKLEHVLGAIEAISIDAPVTPPHVECGDADDTWRKPHNADRARVFISAARDTWSRRARRKADAKLGSVTIQSERPRGKGENETALICCASFLGADDASKLELEFRWVYGWERGLFESFAGHVAGRLMKG